MFRANFKRNSFLPGRLFITINEYPPAPGALYFPASHEKRIQSPGKMETRAKKVLQNVSD